MILNTITEADFIEIWSIMEQSDYIDWTSSGKKSFFWETVKKGYSVCARSDGRIAGFLIVDHTTGELGGLINNIPGLSRKEDWRRNRDFAVELINCAVLPEYRGYHIEEVLIRYAVKKESEKDYRAWFWATVHRDNTASIKSVMRGGLSIIAKNISFPYGSERNVFFRASIECSGFLHLEDSDYQRAAAYSSDNVQKIIDSAIGCLGKVNYEFGKENVEGGYSDCSGFTRYCYRKAGIKLGRDTKEQSMEGFEIPVKFCGKGDLVIFQGTYREGPSHVGIMLDDMWFIHCMRDIGVTISSLEEKYYSGRFHSIRRFVQTVE